MQESLKGTNPYVTLGHNQIFKGPDGNFWTSCHAYTDAGKAWMIMDPIWFEDGKVKTNAPTFTPQISKAFDFDDLIG